jgi:hypothetical protein
VELLKANYATSAEAAAKLPPAIAAFYQQNYPDLYAARPNGRQYIENRFRRQSASPGP